MMDYFDDNVAFLRTIIKANEGYPALTGRTNSGLPAYDAAYPSKVWVTRTDNREERLVWNNGRFIVNPSYTGTPVRIAPTAPGSEWEIIGGDTQKADAFLGAAGSTALSAQRVGALTNEMTAAANIDAGRIYMLPDSDGNGTLTVTAHPFRFTDSDGNRETWQGESSGTLDLTSNVPAASGGINQHRWVLIALDNTAGAAQLVAVNGTPKLYTQPLAETEIDDIALTDEFIPLEAIRLRTGDTTFDDSRRPTIPVRMFLADGSLASGGNFLPLTGGTLSGDLNLGGNALQNFAEQIVAANSGAAYTVDWSAGTIFDLTLTANCTLSFSNLAAGRSITLKLIQDGTGSHTVTWPTITWEGGSAPTLETAASARDVIALTVDSDGVSVFGYTGGSGGSGSLSEITDGVTSVTSVGTLSFDGDFAVTEPSAGTAAVALKKPSSLAASDLATRWEPVTDGDLVAPELIFYNGDIVMAEVA